MTASVISSTSREHDYERRAERRRRVEAVGVVAEADDALDALALGARTPARPIRAVADGHRLAGARPGRGQAVPAGGHDVDQRQEGGLATGLGELLGDRVQGPVRERDAHELGLVACTAPPCCQTRGAPAEQGPAHARRLEPFAHQVQSPQATMYGRHHAYAGPDRPRPRARPPRPCR